MLMELMKKRRSIRKFQDKKVEADKIDLILKAALISPSGRSRKPWEFVVVDDKEKLEKLSNAKPSGAKLIQDAPVAIVVLGDEEKADTWVEDCSIAMTFMQLQGEEFGLGSCWVQLNKRPSEYGEDAESVAKEVIGAENNMRVLAVLALGYPAETKPGYTDEDMEFTKVHYNTYGNFYKK